MADLFTSLVAISQVGDIGDKPVPGTSPQVKKTFSAGRRLQPAKVYNLGHVLGGGAIAYWKLDEPGGTNTVIDYSGSSPANTLATATGTPTVETGQIGNARRFNAAQMSGPANPAAVSIINSAFTTFTFGFWIKTSDFSGFGAAGIRGVLTLCQLGDISNASAYIRFDNNKSLGYGSSNVGNNGWGAFFTGFEDQWVHAVIVGNNVASTATAYRNGVSQGSVSKPTSTNTPTVPTWYLGIGQLGAPANLGNFALDDVWFENGTVSPAAILADYQRGRG